MCEFRESHIKRDFPEFVRLFCDTILNNRAFARIVFCDNNKLLTRWFFSIAA